MTEATIPVEVADPVNSRILAVSEDRIAGFVDCPFEEISRAADLPLDVVLDRLRAMLSAGTIRRIRQTLMATNLAPGALVAWRVPSEKLDSGFDFLSKQDPFSGHVVIRSTDADTPGSAYRLWTTLKVPLGFSMQMRFASCRPGDCSRSALDTSGERAWSQVQRRMSQARCSIRTSSGLLIWTGAFLLR